LAIRSALARAAIRRGSRTMIFLSLAQGSSSRASGTRVVLPAPGGATSTADVLAASVRGSSSSTASIGRGVSKLRGLAAFLMPGLVPPAGPKPLRRSVCPGIRVLAAERKQDVDGRDKPGHDGIKPIYVRGSGGRPTLS